jgi:anti-anti-sigma factor
MNHPDDGYRVWVDDASPHELRVVVDGTLAGAAPAPLVQTAAQASADRPAVLLDLERVSMIDSVGLRAVLEWSRAVEARGARWRIAASPAVRRLLDLVGVGAGD